ncbi:MAG: YgiT-type zinc finger protein [Phycisphaerae bacterium]
MRCWGVFDSSEPDWPRIISMVEITICPSCGKNRIRLVRRDWEGEADGETYTVPDLNYYECMDCGERIYDREAMRRIESHSPAFTRSRTRR